MASLRQVFKATVARNGMLYTLTVDTPFINPHKTLRHGNTFRRQFQDMAHNHADQLESDEVHKIAMEQLEEYLAATRPGAQTAETF